MSTLNPNLLETNMTADHEEWRDVLSNFECFLEHAPRHLTEEWRGDVEGRTAGAKASLAYSWKEDALREFKRVEVSE